MVFRNTGPKCVNCYRSVIIASRTSQWTELGSVYVYIYVCICIYVYTYIYVHTCIYTQTCVHSAYIHIDIRAQCIHTHKHICAHMHIYIDICAHIHTDIYVHTCIYVHRHMCTHAYIHIDIYVHTCIYNITDAHFSPPLSASI